MDEFNEPENTVSHHARLSVKFMIHLLVPIIAFKYSMANIAYILYYDHACCQVLFLFKVCIIYCLI